MSSSSGRTLGYRLLSGGMASYRALKSELARIRRVYGNSQQSDMIANTARKCQCDLSCNADCKKSGRMPEIALADLYTDWRIRPITARLRRQMFDILPDLTGYTVLDLCAGTGIVGLEAVRHGAKHVVMVEINVAACRAIQQVAKKYGISSFASSRHQGIVPHNDPSTARIDVVYGDARKVQIPTKCDLVFVDPPFDRGLVGPILENLRQSDAYHKSTIVLLRTSKRENVGVNWLHCTRKIQHGDGMLHFCEVCTDQTPC